MSKARSQNRVLNIMGAENERRIVDDFRKREIISNQCSVLTFNVKTVTVSSRHATYTCDVPRNCLVCTDLISTRRMGGPLSGSFWMESSRCLNCSERRALSRLRSLQGRQIPVYVGHFKPRIAYWYHGELKTYKMILSWSGIRVQNFINQENSSFHDEEDKLVKTLRSYGVQATGI